MSSPKAGIYYSHYECWGHTCRVVAVGEVFKNRFPKGNLFFIQAGLPQRKAKVDQLGGVYSLPKPLMEHRHFRGPIHRALADIDERGQACLDIVTGQRPDLFITEFFPLGGEECRHELIPSLIKASAQGARLWAVAGYPLLTGTNNGWRQKIFDLYQQITILSPSLERDFIADSFTQAYEKRRYLDFFKRHAQKIKFAGYLLPQQQMVNDEEDKKTPPPPVPKGACRVAVVRGGGAVYPKLIAQAIRASDLLGKEYYLTVVAGPSTTPQEWCFFSSLVARKKINNLLLLKSVGDYEGLIKDNEVCVSMAGYNTSVMLLKYRKKAVLIPFEGYGALTMHEQPSRAAMLKEIIGAKILPIQVLTAQTLKEAIKDAAACKAVSAHVPKELFMGGDVLDKALIGLFGR